MIKLKNSQSPLPPDSPSPQGTPQHKPALGLTAMPKAPGGADQTYARPVRSLPTGLAT